MSATARHTSDSLQSLRAKTGNANSSRESLFLISFFNQIHSCSVAPRWQTEAASVLMEKRLRPANNVHRLLISRIDSSDSSVRVRKVDCNKISTFETDRIRMKKLRIRLFKQLEAFSSRKLFLQNTAASSQSSKWNVQC